MFAQLIIATIGVILNHWRVLHGHTAAAIGAAVAALVLLVPLLLVGATSPGWLQAIYKALPLNAGERLILDRQGVMPSITESWILIAVYPLVALLVGSSLIRRRDA
jgi:hypothetical protein